MDVAVVCACAAVLAAMAPVAGAGFLSPRRSGRPSSLTVNVIRQCGFIPERHNVTSHDGYVTTVFRMRSRGRSGGRAVLFQHGFLSSSDIWFLLGDDSLPCLVASEGFDVWLSNARGNRYSKKHVTLPIQSYAYWNFSFHEMAVNDVAAIIDYICSITGMRRVSFVGHAMGGAIGFVLLSEAPEFNSKVDVSVSLAPACFIGSASNILVRSLLYSLLLSQDLITKLTYGELYDFHKLWRNDKNDKSNKEYIMEIMLGLAHALNLERQDGRSGSGRILQSTSVRTAAHIAMHMRNGTFALYDWGEEGNMAAYGQRKAPDYKLHRITTRQFIMYAEADSLVVPKDAQRLCSALSRGVGTCYRVPKSSFDHYDFVRSSEAKQLVYGVVMRELRAGSPATAPASALPRPCPADHEGRAP